MILRMFILISVLLTSTMSMAEKRVALVVGNGAYTHATKLINPANDARDVTAALQRLGFEVVQGFDLGNDEFDRKINEFSGKLRGADIALFYYSGHGLQFEGSNYLVPVDSRIEGAYSLKKKAVIAQDVFNLMEDGAKASLVFLDACRNNTLVRDLEQSLPEQKRSGTGSRGLARMDAKGNSLIAFAAAPNDVAADGTGSRNSPFTAAVLRHIETPEIVVPEMLTEVTADVAKATGYRQKPEVLSRLTTQVRLKPKLASLVVPVPLPHPPVTLSNREEAARVIWSNELEKSCAKDKLSVFQSRYADTYYGDLAKGRLGEIDAGRQCTPEKPAVAVVAPPVPAAPPVAAPVLPPVKVPLKCDADEREVNGKCVEKPVATVKKCDPDENLTNGKCVTKPAKVVAAPQKKCDPDENLVNGKCVYKLAKSDVVKPVVKRQQAGGTGDDVYMRCCKQRQPYAGDFAWGNCVKFIKNNLGLRQACERQ
jgi:Caspase domain